MTPNSHVTHRARAEALVGAAAVEYDRMSPDIRLPTLPGVVSTADIVRKTNFFSLGGGVATERSDLQKSKFATFQNFKGARTLTQAFLCRFHRVTFRKFGGFLVKME